METNDPHNLTVLAEKLSHEDLSKWLNDYLRNWRSNDPPISVPPDYLEPGSFLGALLDTLAPDTWDSPTHGAFGDAALRLLSLWEWSEHPAPLSHEDKIYVEDVLYFLEKYPNSNPRIATYYVWRWFTSEKLEDDICAKTLLTCAGQFYRHPAPQEYQPWIPILELELERKRATFPAYSCMLGIDKIHALSHLGKMYRIMKTEIGHADNLFCDVAIRFRDDWPVLLEKITGQLGEDEQAILAGLEDNRQFIKQHKKTKNAVAKM